LFTTNKSFAEWSEVFPNAACVVALIFRGSSTLLTHAAVDRCQKWAKSYRYALKIDIACYFRPLIIPYAKQADTLGLRKRSFPVLLFPSRSGYLAARESYESGIVSLVLLKKCLEIS